MITITNNSSSTIETLVVTLGGAAATTYPTITVDSYITLPNTEIGDFSDYTRGSEYTLLTTASETTIAAAQPEKAQKNIFYAAFPNPDTASVTLTVSVDQATANKLQAKAVLGVGSILYYEDRRGWYVLDASGGEVTSSSIIYASWTPTDASGAALTFTGVTGTYQLISGGICIAQCQFTYPATADASAAKVGGLPFAVSNTDAAQQGSIAYASTANAGRTGLVKNTTTAGIYTTAGAATTNAQMTLSQFNAQYIYRVA